MRITEIESQVRKLRADIARHNAGLVVLPDIYARKENLIYFERRLEIAKRQLRK